VDPAPGRDDYRRLNQANWDDRVPIHVGSPDYAADRFDDPDFLSGVVRFDRPRLGDLRGVRGIHLQCHIGTDTVSLTRLGAAMTGLDFSPPALVAARSLATRTGADATFLEGDVYDAVAVAGAAAYDLVYTGIGALCWLPDVRRWAQVVADLLAPAGGCSSARGPRTSGTTASARSWAPCSRPVSSWSGSRSTRACRTRRCLVGWSRSGRSSS
jgi:SAM-dependent methyltransferase